MIGIQTPDSSPQGTQIVGQHLWTKAIRVLSGMCKQLSQKNHGNLLTIEDEHWNASVANNHIIVEIFCCLTKLWGVISTRYWWMEEGYNDIFWLCIALTNFHVSFHPLGDNEDANHYTQYKNCNYKIGERIANKHKAIQKNIVKDTIGAFAWKLARHPAPPIVLLAVWRCIFA